ncbi:hypothetical protein GOODEAATRI_023898 [Goodea atripinnis]|uniref:Vomeronasal type-1 receptor n=1 Tax=Goodea atripinnis TaxID=208336 RepID=A0ABV0P0P2_9TELE
MIWTTVFLGGLCVFHFALTIRAEISNSPWGRTVTLSRSQTPPRHRRDTSTSTGTSTPSRGPAFTSCRLPLTPTEQKILDDNTQEFEPFCHLFLIDRNCPTHTVFSIYQVILVLSTISGPLNVYLAGGSSRLYRR